MKRHAQKALMMGAVLLSSGAFAESKGIPCNQYDNFYVGANIGAASLLDKESTNNPIRDVHHLSAIGILGGGLVGYDFTLRDSFKLGLEGFVNATDLNLSDNQNYAPVTSYTVDMRYNLGLRLLPGYEFTPNTIGHIILGYSYAQFQINDNGNYGIIHSQFQKNGFQFGLGAKTAVFKNLALRADLLYTAYASQTSNGITTTTPSGTQIYKNSLAVFEGNLALVYKFS